MFEWQSEEGWFQEYEGCDPGYHTLTIDFLAKYYAKSKDDTVLEPLRKAIEFASYFIHPDGSYGGEYGSRNTFNFYPHGFELMGRIYPLATQITDRFLLGIKSGKRAYLEDERIFFHTVVNFLQAYIDYNDNRSGSLEERGDFVRDFDKAGIYVRSEKSSYAVISTAKGGVVKLFKNGEHLYSDNGLIARLRNFSIVVTHQVDRYETNIDKMRVEVSGQFGFIRPRFANPLKFILFRIGLLVLGRFSSNLIRGVLQRMLITGKRKAPIAFKRTFVFGDKIKIIDEIKYLFPLAKKELYIEKLFAGTDHTSIYVAASNSYQESALQPWVDYADLIGELEGHGTARYERVIE